MTCLKSFTNPSTPDFIFLKWLCRKGGQPVNVALLYIATIQRGRATSQCSTTVHCYHTEREGNQSMQHYCTLLPYREGGQPVNAALLYIATIQRGRATSQCSTTVHCYHTERGRATSQCSTTVHCYHTEREGNQSMQHYCTLLPYREREGNQSMQHYCTLLPYREGGKPVNIALLYIATIQPVLVVLLIYLHGFHKVSHCSEVLPQLVL